MNNRHDANSSSTLIAVIVVLIVMMVVGAATMFNRVQKQRMLEARQMELVARDNAEQARRRQQQTEEDRPSEPNHLRVLTWNVESGGNDPNVIAKQLTDLGAYDIFGLCEVDPANVNGYTRAAGDNFKSIVSETGRSDRLVLIYDSKRLELTAHFELEEFEGTRLNDEELRHRSPLVGTFKDKRSGFQFQVLLVHLARGWSELRQQQALGLRKWVAAQDSLTLGIGDFNFDYDFPSQKGNAAFEIFTEGNAWQWVKPDPLVDTNWADRDEDGNDDYPDSCLDFTFVGDSKIDWKGEANVIVRDGDFPDNESTSDHRPVELLIDFR